MYPDLGRRIYGSVRQLHIQRILFAGTSEEAIQVNWFVSFDVPATA
jgi:hypothetical protein